MKYAAIVAITNKRDLGLREELPKMPLTVRRNSYARQA